MKKWLNNDGLVDFSKTKKLLCEVDAKAEALKKEIMEAEDKMTVVGKSYYVSEKNGDDSNDGLSPESAWKTFKNVNDGPVTYHDGVYFERGGTYRGQIKCKSGVTYAAYGKGAKPRIIESPENGACAHKWSLVEGTENIWLFYKPMPDVGVIVFNEGQSYADGTAQSIKRIPAYVGGRFVDRGDMETPFDIKKHLDVDLAHFNNCDRYKNSEGYPDVANPGNVGELYLRCDKGNPGELFESIEFAVRGNVICVGSNRDVHIDNLAIMYGGSHGVGAGTCKGLHVTNCVFGWIGGAIHRYYTNGARIHKPWRFGNAVEIYGGCDDYVCDHNYIYQVYDAGLTHQLSSGGVFDCIQKNARYTRNLIEYCTYSFEYFLGRAETVDCVRFQQNITVKNNIMRFAGFGFGEQRPEADCHAAHIKGWEHSNPLDEGFVIENNIFDRSRNMMMHCGAGKTAWLPAYNGNVYIQYSDNEESSLGRYGVSPTKLYPYPENVRQIMNELNMDPAGGVYFCRKDELFDLPAFLPKNLRK